MYQEVSQLIFTLIISFNPYNKEIIIIPLYDSEKPAFKITPERPFAGTGNTIRKSDSRAGAPQPHTPLLLLSKPHWSLFTAWHKSQGVSTETDLSLRHCDTSLSLILFFTFSSSIFIYNQAMIFV